MDEEGLRQLWLAWASIAIGGDYARQRAGASAAIDAIKAGADQVQAVAAARDAAARWSEPPVYSPPFGQIGVPAAAATPPRQILPDVLPPAMVPAPPVTPMPAAPAAATPAASASRRLVDHPLFVPGAAGGVAVLLIVAILVLLVGGNSNTTLLASDSADSIVTQAALTVAHWGSYHAHLQAHSGQGSADVKYADSSTLSIETTKAGSHAHLLTTSNRYFVSGNAAFYQNNPVLAQHAADRWIEVKGTANLLSPADSSPAVGATCILETHGTLTKKGSSKVNGRPAIEIDDAGDKPGTTRSKLFISTDGTADLLRVEETSVTSGSPSPQCASGFGSSVTDKNALATIDIDQINSHIDISVPTDVLHLDDPPFCGTPVSQNLSAAAQQFLLLLYVVNERDAHIAAECGCPNPRFDQFHQSMVDVVANDIAFVNGLAQLPLDASQRDLANKAIAAFRPLIANESAQAQAGSFAEARPLWTAHEQLSQAAGNAAEALHQALGVPIGTCSFDAPA